MTAECPICKINPSRPRVETCLKCYEKIRSQNPERKEQNKASCIRRAEKIKLRKKEYYAQPEIKIHAQKKAQEWYEKNPDRQRNSSLLRRYGITVDIYENILKSQNGLCAVCDRPPKKRRLNVDHNHLMTGKESVRGLLCSICNHKIIGLIERYRIDPNRIAAYLNFHCNRQKQPIIRPPKENK